MAKNSKSRQKKKMSFASKSITIVLVLLACYMMLAFGSTKVPDNIYDLTVLDADNNEVQLSKYKGKVLVIANLASQCAHTESGYTRLNQLYDRFASRGLEVLGFPCNQFGAQEPGTNGEVLQFAKAKGANWPVFAKIDVNGLDAHPLYKFLKGEGKDSNGCVDDEVHCQGWAEEGECEANPKYMLENCKASCKVCEASYAFAGDVAWNFEYFVVNRDGTVVGRYRSRDDITGPNSIAVIQRALEQEPGDRTEL